MSYFRLRELKIGKLLVVSVLSIALMLVWAIPAHAEPANSEEGQAQAGGSYQIYPTPHKVAYQTGKLSLSGVADLVVEDGIDSDTARRLDDALALQKIVGLPKEQLSTKANLAVLVGIKGSGGVVDKQVAALKAAGKLDYDPAVFEKTDSYLLAAIPGTEGNPPQILVLGRDTDSAYYGLTTLYQILQQIPSDNGKTSLNALTVTDWADVPTRGFIEGYYGNPWSTQNRIDLMEWGGYYKLNAYIYAPKDDPKHNAKWRELYSSEELNNKIAPLAKAGNESKTRFVYALHPFMYNPITSGNYDQGLKIAKAKYRQVIDAGVRQISVLADDAKNQGNDLYIRLLKDLTDWVKQLQKEKTANGELKYPGLKEVIIFCPVNYGGAGEAWYNQLPETVKVINTGGRVWGKADGDFLGRFKNNSGGRATFMWMNFPCSDNDKDALHMGNYENFLGLNVQPGQLEGLVMNPMQQSEPSKQGIFMNADFSWNLWRSLDHADKTWLDSFSYLDNNSPLASDAANALRDLSQHLRRMYGGGATWEGRESAEVKDTLVSFQRALENNQVTKEQITKVRKVYTDIKPAVDTYRSKAKNVAMRSQMEPWLGAFVDLVKTAELYLDAYSAHLDNDKDGLVNKYLAGNAQLSAYNQHGFNYVNETKYAKVGKAYLTPTVAAMARSLKSKVARALDPDAVIYQYVTSRSDTPEGNIASVTDGNDGTGVTYKNPNKITAGTFAGITSDKPFDADRLTFVLGGGKDFFDRAKLQTFDGTNWNDVPGKTGLTGTVVDLKNLNLKQIRGARLIATADNARDAWFVVKEIEVNRTDKVSPTVTLTSMQKHSGELSNVTDGNPAGTPLWLKRDPYEGEGRDKTPVGAAVTVDYGKVLNLKQVTFAQGPGNDTIDSGILEYSADGTNWEKLADVNGDKVQTTTLKTPVQAKAIRVRNLQETNKWWQVNELSGVDASDMPDKTALNTQISQAEQLKEADYTVFTWQVLTGALQAAKGVQANPTARQDEIDQSANALEMAIKGLKKSGGEVEPADPTPEIPTEKPVDKVLLDNTIQAAGALAEKDYSEETWKQLAQNLQKAKDVNSDKNAKQTDVDKALNDLRSAIKALKAADAPITPDKPDTPEKPDTPGTPDNPQQPDKPDNPEKPDNPGTNPAGPGGSSATPGNKEGSTTGKDKTGNQSAANQGKRKVRVESGIASTGSTAGLLAALSLSAVGIGLALRRRAR